MIVFKEILPITFPFNAVFSRNDLEVKPDLELCTKFFTREKQTSFFGKIGGFGMYSIVSSNRDFKLDFSPTKTIFSSNED
jgi:hypothetical protein